MQFLRKCFRFIFGFFLFLFYTRRLNYGDVVNGKRVAIVGAANSAYNSNKGSYIDNFDIVIRINKAPWVLKEGKWAQDIGSRADILFHSFFENNVSGGGPLDLGLYDQLGIKVIINPIAAYSGYRVLFNFYKKYLSKRIIYTLSGSAYADLVKELHGHQPTIGFCALKETLQADFSELYITGFTFFKTAFGEGYRNDMKEASQVQKFIKDAGLHDPDLEFELFLRLLDANAGKNIVLDRALDQIVASYK